MKLKSILLLAGLTLGFTAIGSVNNSTDILDITPRQAANLNSISEVKSFAIGTNVNFKASINGYINDDVAYVSDLTGHGIKITMANFKSNGNYPGLMCNFTGTVKYDNGPVVEVVNYTPDYSNCEIPVAYDLDLATINDSQIGDFVNVKGLEYTLSEDRNGMTNFYFIAGDGNEISVRGLIGDVNTNTIKSRVDAIEGVGDITITGNLAKSDSKYYIDITDQTGFIQYELTDPALDVANMIINDLSCDNGVTKPDVEIWDTIALFAKDLPEQDLKYFKKADAEDPFIGEAIAKYDYILSKYGDTEYQNFLNRYIIANGQNTPVVLDNTNMVITIVSISIIAISSIAVLVIYKRKKAIN